MTVSTLAPRARRRMQPPAPADPVTQYALDVVAGRIVAGILVRKACERHLRDLADAHKRGLHFDVAEATKAIAFYPLLHHYRGRTDAILLEPWQAFIVGSAWGWKRADGRRRFRFIYVEVAAKNGKTTIGAGAMIRLAFFDGEPGAEVYSLASKREQAKIGWGAGAAMVRQSPALRARGLRVYGGRGQMASIAQASTASFYQPLGKDSDSDQGINPHGALLDELHVYDNRDLVDNVEKAASARRQPMIWKITTAGVKRQSVWADERADAVSIIEGRATDDSTFAVIYTLDTDPRAASLVSYAALRWMIQSCTCRPRDTASTRSSAARTPTNEQSAVGFAPTATSETYSSEIPNTLNERMPNGRNGRRETPTEFAPPLIAGESETRGRSLSGNASSSSALPPRNTTDSSSSRIHAVGSVEFDQTVSALTTITTLGQFEDFCASNATARSASSEIVQRVYTAHLPTCSVRRAPLRNDALEVTLPGDDPFDEAVWPKANPNLGVSVQLDFLRERAAKAQRSPGAMAAFLRYHMDVPTAVSTRALDIEEWDLNAGNPDGLPYDEWVAATIPAAAGGYEGLDLASVKDLTALVILFRLPGDDDDATARYAALCRFWCPEDGVRERSQRDGVPYADWVRDGYLIATPGNVTDYSYVRAEQLALAEQYAIGDVGFDKWNATQLVTELMADGANCTAIPQTHAGLGPAWRELEKLVLDHRLLHGGHPILRWMAANVEVETDSAGNQKPSKRHSAERIDGMVALDMALNRWLAHGEAPGIWTAA